MKSPSAWVLMMATSVAFVAASAAIAAAADRFVRIPMVERLLGWLLAVE